MVMLTMLMMMMIIIIIIMITNIVPLFDAVPKLAQRRDSNKTTPDRA